MSARVPLLLLAGLLAGCIRGEVRDISTFRSVEVMTLPPTQKRGSVANQAWRDYDAWVQSITVDRPDEVRLAFVEDLPVRALGDCTGRIWSLDFEGYLLRIDGNGKTGTDHVIHRPVPDLEIDVIALRAGGGLEGLRTRRLATYDGDAFACSEEDVPEDWPRLDPRELAARAAAATASEPLYLYLDEDARFSELRELLLRLEQLGAHDFVCLTYMK